MSEELSKEDKEASDALFKALNEALVGYKIDIIIPMLCNMLAYAAHMDDVDKKTLVSFFAEVVDDYYKKIDGHSDKSSGI